MTLPRGLREVEGWWYLSNTGLTCFHLDYEPHPDAIRFSTYKAHRIAIPKRRGG